MKAAGRADAQPAVEVRVNQSRSAGEASQPEAFEVESGVLVDLAVLRPFWKKTSGVAQGSALEPCRERRDAL